jgi:cell division protein ZapA (FtsZ GTPase activity inhibitor)
MFMDTVEEIDEKLNELARSVDDRIQAMNEVNAPGSQELPF